MADQVLQQLAAATPTASGHAQAGTSSQKVHGPTDSLQVVTALARLGYTRPTFARNREPDDSHHLDLRRHHANRAPGHSPDLQGETHSSGMAQRVVMWCKLIIALRQAYAAIKPEEVQELPSGQKERVIRTTGGEQAGWEAAAAHWHRGLARTQSLSEIAPNQIEQENFRLKPTSREPLQGKPWVWNLVSTAAATPEFKQHLAALAAFGPKPEQIHVAPGRVRDGPIISTLTEWLDTQPEGKGRGKGKNKGNRGNSRRGENEASMGMDALGDNDMGTETRSQRRRRVQDPPERWRQKPALLTVQSSHQNSPPLLSATGCAWCSAEPRTAVGPPRGAPHAFAVFSRHGGAEASQCGLPTVLSAIVRVAEQYARSTLPSTEAANCGNALADLLNMGQHSGTPAGHERSHTFHNELKGNPRSG